MRLLPGWDTVSFEAGTKIRLRPAAALLAVAAILVPLLVWRNVSYAAESLDPSLAFMAVEIPAVRKALAEASQAESPELEDYLLGLEDQQVADRFDVARSSTPGSAEAALGLAAGIGGPLLGLLFGALLVTGDFTERTMYYPVAWSTSRRGAFSAKLAMVPALAAVSVSALAVMGLAAGSFFNNLYRDQPSFGWNGDSVPRLGALWLSAAAIVTLWGWIGVGLAFALRSSLAAATVLGVVLAVDALLTLRAGLGRFLLTMRIAQLGLAFWPPPARRTIDTLGYQWWVSPHCSPRIRGHPARCWGGRLRRLA